MDEMRRIWLCKYCGKPEYYGDFRWLSGRMLCRKFYKAICEWENKKPYILDDLNGKVPTMEEYEKQEAEENAAIYKK